MAAKGLFSRAALLAGASCLQFGVAYAQEGCGEALNLENADIRSVVDEIAIRTGKKFVLDPRVQGQVSIKSGPNGGLCADEAWELFQAALRVTGFTAAPINSDSYRIIPIQEGSRAAGPVNEGERGDFVTQIVRLNHIDSREAAANLAQLVSERGVVAPVRSGNAVILVDVADNVKRLQQVLAQLDRDTTVYRTIPLENASAAEVARVLTNLAREISEEGAPGAGSVSVVPVAGSNSVLVRAEPVILSRLIGVVAELDRIGKTQSDLSVITLNHSDAEEMSTLLKELATAQAQAATAEGVAPAPSGPSRANISFHKATNSVIISGDADIQQTLRKVVQQLDVRRAQVQIEAIIVEVSDTTARALGIEYFLSPTGGKTVPFTASTFTSATPNILAAAGALLLNPNLLGGDDSGTGGDDDDDAVVPISAELADAAVQSLLGSNGFIGGIGGTFGGQDGDDVAFGVVLNALKRDTNSNVLSFPSVVTLDNQEAKLSVGQEIPITTGEAVGDNFQNAFRTVTREQVGVILEVTPQINEGGTVTMKIRQETSSVAMILTTTTDFITNKREIETTALVDDGEILVVGGLIDQTDGLTEEKVPLLGDIPIAGNLFKSSSRTRDRRNLVVFLRPTIIRDRAAGQAVTQKKLDYIKARELLSSGGPQSEIERLIDQVTGGTDPGAESPPPSDPFAPPEELTPTE